MKTRSVQSLFHDLRQPMAALDRRVPRIGRAGERAIARDAQRVRRAALKRVCELERFECAQARRRVAQEAA